MAENGKFEKCAVPLFSVEELVGNDVIRAMTIHPTAIVDSEATLGENVSIGPYSIIEGDVVIGSDCSIANNVVIKSGVRMGSGCRVHSNVVVGDDPQYVGWDTNLKTGVILGDGCTLRENVTIHRSIYEGKNTVLGNDVYVMVGAHIAHDCLVGNEVIIINDVLLAGHVEIGDRAFIGGGVCLHQFVRVGEGSMTGGNATITRDIAPFIMVSERDHVSGLNLVGLKRRGFSREVIKELKELFQMLFHTPGNIRKQAESILEERKETLSDEALRFVQFFVEGKRGFCGVDLKNK